MAIKIIDTFLFSEPHEVDLLYLKMELEQDVVNKWIIQENSYTLQGNPKELHAKSVLDNDPRFAKFRERIAVVSLNQNFASSNDENANFVRENVQRTGFTLLTSEQMAQGMNIEKGDQVFYIISDVDEMIDFSDQTRKDQFLNIAKDQTRPFWIKRQRYWYDYDNKCFLDDLHIPIIPACCMTSPSFAYEIALNARHYKNRDLCFGDLDNPMAFEYSYVFKSINDLWRKKCTYAHTNFTMESLEEGLKLNAWPRPKERGEARGPHDFFEKIELTETNSPKYVRDNLDKIKTNIVDPSYKENREVN